ncbi:30S ribosomal protein S20 [Lipingzhangella sp. LS1_29]|uniref:Small ribosomal subunit protein bS20 n=1 Tax=Lipingzhangella rawalii TaxID=2055835 RepID=A0ABU2H8J4_9ACTN|nr:30S ribosomal protein S20 [Lipingzhangella rawalii]MDS1271170.1 30S ribosomal protein S20 [Lipingzhangella rawalii]
MANIKQQRKRVRQNEERRVRNKAVKSSLKTAIRKFRLANEAGRLEEARTLQRDAARQLDKAVSKGVIHKNQAANRKRRMAARLNKKLAEQGG